ncbi:hypothetical protein [Pontibacter sp. H249]|uniref:hypothetical protein n=1 Tax=Pontibacter sp. H249 TaxID=3133420 RepID=UPI0030C53B9D
MVTKPNLLIVGEYNRKDYIDLFKASQHSFNYYFLEYISPKEVKNKYYKNFGKAIFWGDYKSANDLLQIIRPDKVVFFFIESYFHVILNLACKTQNISTYLMDHGIRDSNINIRLEQHFVIGQRTSVPSRIKKIFHFKEHIKAQIFLRNSIKDLSKEELFFFSAFYNIRSKNDFINTFKIIDSPLRTANIYISFSSKTFDVHKYYDHLSNNKKVHFIGIPSYDHLVDLKPKTKAKSQILFIDQGLVTRRFFGWTEAIYKHFIVQFNKICSIHGYQLLVKLHPIQPETDIKLWSSLSNARIIENEDLMLQLPFTRLIVGFSSTYLLPLAALEYTTLITLENHPAGKLDVSKSFIDAGVAHPVYKLEELHQILPNIAQFHQQQLPNKAKFTEEWMYKFDGKSGERLRNILLSNEL